MENAKEENLISCMENAKEEVEIGWKIVYMKVHKPLKH